MEDAPMPTFSGRKLSWALHINYINSFPVGGDILICETKFEGRFRAQGCQSVQGFELVTNS